ncbi:polyketide synthase-like protein [Whalleya microplaca]|nr:polyketide synthase-like protein [Whalleya microplaca]
MIETKTSKVGVDNLSTLASASPAIEDEFYANHTEQDTEESNLDEEDLACIVGIGCRLPGGIQSPMDLWNFLSNGESAQGQIPVDRFNIKGFYHPDGSRAGVMDADGGYFIQEDVRQFDNDFFGINKLEAMSMDPQQRKLLEVVFECFENAGVSMEQMSGTNTGVYVGNFTFDHIVRQARDSDYSNRYSATGSGIAIASNRISHVFDLHGPSFTLDTGCSSSLYCLHNAVCALRSGDCDGAVVASANLITSPEQHMGTMKGGVISRTSTCHTFDIAANGYGRAEAVNAVYLKTLASARRDGNKIWAVIRGTAINANGRTPGISHPSSKDQEAVIRKAYANAALGVTGTDYVECHGTGTAIGDPIEVEAIRSCFNRRGSLPLLIGAAKPGLGHSEAASGLTSLIKVVLAFHYAKIPPTCGVKNLNPKLQLDSANIQLVTEMKDWPRALRRASINAFGYGGANAHCILESSDSYMRPFRSQVPDTSTGQGSSDKLFLMPVSATSIKALETRVDHISKMIAHYNSDDLERLAFNLASRRSHLRRKAFLLAQAGSDGGTELPQSDVAHIAELDTVESYPTAFIYTGQGAQYAGMAKELLQHGNNVFLNTIRELDGILQLLPADLTPNWTLEQTLCEDSSLVHHVAQSQPLCTAIQVALTNLLRHWGILPSAVVGHSSGEIAAAYAAGLLTMKQAILTAYFRGYVVGKLPSCGSMMAVGMSAQDAESLITGPAGVSVACVNAPNSVTLSGSSSSIEILLDAMQGLNIFSRKLETGGRAYHSPMMKDIGALYEDLLTPIFPHEAQVKTLTAEMYSSVGVDSHDITEVCGGTNMAKYWRNNLEKPVQFSSAMARMLDGKKLYLLEIGPHSTLKGPIKQILDELNLNNLPYTPTLMRKEPAHIRMKKVVGELYLRGYNLNWDNINDISKRNMTPLTTIPPYPWDYTAGLLWDESRPSVELRQRRFVRHELLGVLQLAGNGIDWTWRNVLRLKEVSWLRDHKLETQIVFPAVGYLNMAMVAISQIQANDQSASGDYRAGHDKTAFEFRNVKISAALVLHEGNEHVKEVELHTSMSQRKISTASVAADWFDFQISLWRDGQATLHCAGSLRTVNSTEFRETLTVHDTQHYETWPSMVPWYNKLAQEGLCFGSQFQLLDSLRTDRSRVRSAALSSTLLNPLIIDHRHSHYPVHPLVVDACVQAAIFGSTAGNLSTLRAFLPVFISECRIGMMTHNDKGGEAIIHSQTTTTGFTTRRIDCTLWDAHGTPKVHLKDVQMQMYTGKTQDPAGSNRLQRYPCLFTHWKPDILRINQRGEAELNDYIKRTFKWKSFVLGDDNYISDIAAIIDLVGHKTPQMRVLDLGGEYECHKKQLLSLLDNETAFPRCKSWHTHTFGKDSVELRKGEIVGPFDIILISGDKLSGVWARELEQITSLLSDYGVVLGSNVDSSLRVSLQSASFTTLKVGEQSLLAIRERNPISLQGRNVIVLVRHPSPIVLEFAESLVEHIKQSAGVNQARYIEFDKLNAADISENVACISLLEVEHELLASISSEDMDLLHRITEKVTDILWITGANMIGDPNPDLALSNGFARALMLEQPSLRFSVMDVGNIKNSHSYTQSTCQNVVQALIPYHDLDDKEFMQQDGLLYISRFGPDFDRNLAFRRRLEKDEPKQVCTIAEAGQAHLSIDKVGLGDSMYFQQVCVPSTAPPAGFVDVAVKAVSLNAKDIYAMGGRVETRGGTTSLEFSGIVTAVGPDVVDLREGDRVVVMAPNHFSTTERVPAWSAFKMLPDEEFIVMPTLATVYCTALYALNDRANLQAGESVLIHAGSGALGVAAITIAQRIGAIIYSTVGSAAKKRFMVEKLGLSPSHIFSSRDESFVEDIMASTEGRGVDVVINSLTGDLMHAGWRCVANFGRFVEVGKRELIDAGKLDMDVFLRNATFTSFDLTELWYSERKFHRDILICKMNEALSLYRSGQIQAAPITSFDVTDIAKAYSYFSSMDRVGKIVISMENPESRIPVVPSTYLTCFDQDKVYLLVGCLGGLGRSLSRWMMARGARNFVFLGRTGSERSAARELVSHIESVGAEVAVVRGDVSHLTDVTKAVDACRETGKPIGGVIQAAMGLQEALFYRMNSEAWHKAIQPKRTGTWNLHKALNGFDGALDFFLLTSSVTGSVGSVAESNYCAANAFLNAFARFRRCQGKPAVSIGLGMIEEVGYLHDNPKVEALLLRRGIQPFNENEFLQVIDLALSGDGISTDAQTSNDSSGSHVLTGLEPLGIRDPSRGINANEGTMQDPRMAIIAAALAVHQLSQDAEHHGRQLSHLAVDIPWLKNIATNAAEIFLSEADAPSLGIAALRLIRKQFSKLMLVSPEKIDDQKPLADFGIDSMLATEFRSWLWASFKVDVPFLDILSSSKSLAVVASYVTEKLTSAGEGLSQPSIPEYPRNHLTRKLRVAKRK